MGNLVIESKLERIAIGLTESRVEFNRPESNVQVRSYYKGRYQQLYVLDRDELSHLIKALEQMASEWDSQEL